MKYIKRIVIENFQSHKYSEINFDADLNILIGQSDKGKSAVIRALKWVLYNEPRGTDFVRYGTTECSVTVVMGDGYTVIRRRKKTKNIYIIINPDGQTLEFENFGNDVPPEVIDATGVKKIKLDTDKEAKLNFNEQLDPPFLLSETGTLRAKSIGRIVNTNIIDAAERDIMKDISNNNISIKNFDRQLEEIENDLLMYSEIDIEGKIIEKIELLLQTIDTINQKIQKLNEVRIKIHSVENQIFHNKEVVRKLKDTHVLIDKFAILKDNFNTFDVLNSFKNKLSLINNQLISNSTIVQNLKDVHILVDKFAILRDNFNTFDVLNSLKNKLSLINTQLVSNNTIVQNLKDIESLDSKTKVLEQNFYSFETIKSLHMKISSIDKSIYQNQTSLKKLINIDILEINIKDIQNKLDTLNTLNVLSQKLIDNNSSISKGKDYYDSLIKDLKNKVKQYSKSLKELGKCPTCYSIISDLSVAQIINEMEGDLNDN